jgi:hypothetical protein
MSSAIPTLANAPIGLAKIRERTSFELLQLLDKVGALPCGAVVVVADIVVASSLHCGCHVSLDRW